MMKSTLYYLILVFLFPVALVSCGSENNSTDEPPSNPGLKITVLIYAVVSNLNLESDKSEILEAASELDLKHTSLVIYQGEKEGNNTLVELAIDDNEEYCFNTLKDYGSDGYSADRYRLSEVINDVLDLREAEKYGIVFWSHSSSWQYYDNQVTRVGNQYERTLPEMYSFGIDKDGVQLNIDELADAIPDGMFSFIWFDSCYMSGIETIYELRNKCDYFVGSPTEVPGFGMPYNLTMPYILTANPDLVGAANAFFDHYAEKSSSATIAVVDMGKLEGVADYCKVAYSNYSKVNAAGLLYYHQPINPDIGPFYDFGQYTKKVVEGNEDSPSLSEFENAMSEFVIWKNATPKGFNRQLMNEENFSGISCHLYDPSATDENANYYKTLDWFQRVY